MLALLPHWRPYAAGACADGKQQLVLIIAVGEGCVGGWWLVVVAVVAVVAVAVAIFAVVGSVGPVVLVVVVLLVAVLENVCQQWQQCRLRRSWCWRRSWL